MSEVKNEVKSSVLTKLDLLKAWFKWCLAVEVRSASTVCRHLLSDIQ